MFFKGFVNVKIVFFNTLLNFYLENPGVYLIDKSGMNDFSFIQLSRTQNSLYIIPAKICFKFSSLEAEFKEFETRLKHGEIVFSVSRFEPALNWNRFLTVQLSGLNSLNFKN